MASVLHDIDFATVVYASLAQHVPQLCTLVCAPMVFTDLIIYRQPSLRRRQHSYSK